MMNWFKTESKGITSSVDVMTPEERRAALARMSALDKDARQTGASLTPADFEAAAEFGENAPINMDVSEMDFTPEPVKLVGIEAAGYQRATQAMLDAATERDTELAAAIEKNRVDAQNENTRLNEERAKNKKIIESTLAALSVFTTPEPQMPCTEAKARRGQLPMTPPDDWQPPATEPAQS